MAQNNLRNFSKELPKEPSLFQNLFTDLAEKLFKAFFLFIALVAICSMEGNRLSNFG